MLIRWVILFSGIIMCWLCLVIISGGGLNVGMGIVVCRCCRFFLVGSGLVLVRWVCRWFSVVVRCGVLKGLSR